MFDNITKTVYINGDRIDNASSGQTKSSGGNTIWFIIGALVLIVIGTGAYIIIKNQTRKGEF